MTWRRWFHRDDDSQWFDDWAVASRWHNLARYNAEVSHGIVHTPEYAARMAAEQADFYAETEAQREAGHAAARRVRYPG